MSKTRTPKKYVVNGFETNSSQKHIHDLARTGAWCNGVLGGVTVGATVYMKGVFDASKELGSEVIRSANEMGVWVAGGASATLVGAMFGCLATQRLVERSVRTEAAKQEAAHIIPENQTEELVYPKHRHIGLDRTDVPDLFQQHLVTPIHPAE